MKRLTVLFFIGAMALVACNNAQTNVSDGAVEIKTIDIETWKKLALSGDGVILDVRTQEEVNGGYIKGASHIDIYDSDFERKVNMIQKNKPVYVYCKSGGRSATAVEAMGKLGFKKVYNLQGGIMAWQATGNELVKPEGSATTIPEQISMSEFENLIKGDVPVLVDFNATWCVPCKKMLPVIDKMETDYKDKIKVVKIDVDAASDLVTHYKVQAVPTFIIFRKGVNTWQHQGMISETDLKSIIESNLN